MRLRYEGWIFVKTYATFESQNDVLSNLQYVAQLSHKVYTKYIGIHKARTEKRWGDMPKKPADKRIINRSPEAGPGHNHDF